MKSRIHLIFLFVFLTITTISLFAQKPADLTGTWTGMATLESEAEPNDLTLVLEVQEGGLIGRMTDQYGTMTETPIEEVSIEEGVFSFSLFVEVPSGSFKIEFKMKVAGDSMKGELYVPDLGMSGTWEAEKQK